MARRCQCDLRDIASALSELTAARQSLIESMSGLACSESSKDEIGPLFMTISPIFVVFRQLAVGMVHVPALGNFNPPILYQSDRISVVKKARGVGVLSRSMGGVKNQCSSIGMGVIGMGTSKEG